MARVYVHLIICALCFAGGWVVHGWKSDSEIAAIRKAETAIAAQVEKKLHQLKAEKTVIEREKIKIIDRPVYSNQCLDNSGMLLINRSKSAKPADEVQ